MARVLTLYDRLPPEPDGGADFVARLGQELSDLGHEHAFLVPPGRGANPILTSGSEIFETVAAWSDDSVSAVSPVAESINRWDPDVLHIVYPGKDPASHRLPFALLRLRLVPTTLTVFPVGLRGRGFEEWRSLARALHAASTVVVSAPEQTAWLTAVFPWLGRKIWNIPSGGSVPTPRGRPGDLFSARSHLGLDPAQVYFGHFGYLYRGKRIDDLIAACGLLAQERVDFELLLIGGQGLELRTGEMAGANAFVRSLVGQIQSLGLNDRVTATGFLNAEKAEGYLTACDAIVFPARRFALGRSTAVAALASGVPLVAPAPFPKSHVENVTEWGNAIFYSRRDRPRQLLGCLRRISLDKSVRQRMRRIALEMAPLWSWPTLARRYELALTRYLDDSLGPLPR